MFFKIYFRVFYVFGVKIYESIKNRIVKFN